MTTIINIPGNENIKDSRENINTNFENLNNDKLEAADIAGKQDILAEGPFVDGDKTKLDSIEANAEVNNISDVNATDLTDGGDSTLHFHSSDRDRVNHTGTQSADTIVDGTTNKVLTTQQKQYYTNLTSTSIVTGFAITINSSTTVDIGAGTGVVVDNYTDPLNPVVYPVDFAGLTNVTINNIANGVTYLSIDKDGNVVQSPNEPERENLRDAFVIGAAVSTDGISIGSIDEYTFSQSLDVALNLDDFITAIGGLINPEGNAYFRGTTNPLGLNKTAGQIFWFGANYKNNKKDPNYLNTPALTDLSFVTVWRDGLGGFNTGASTASITTGIYDDGTGGATQPNGNLPNQRFANHRLYYDGSNNLTVLQYGQVIHRNIDDAVVSASTESFEKDPRLNGLMFRGWLTVRGNVTDLGDITRAKFTPGGFFQDVGGGALANIPDNLQGVYNNSTAGEITTNPTNGALTIQQGSGLDTDFVYEGRNGAGTNTFTVSGEGDIEANKYNGVELTNGGTGSNYLSDDGTYSSGFVNLTTAQTIAGTKTFTNSPQVPLPILDTEVASKKYVDDNAGGGSFPTNIYVSEKIATGTNGVNTFTHNLGLTEDDVLKGKYKVVVMAKVGSGVQFGDTSGSNFYWGGSPLDTYHQWSTSNPSNANAVIHQSNSFKIYFQGGTNMSDIVVVLQQMY